MQPAHTNQEEEFRQGAKVRYAKNKQIITRKQEEQDINHTTKTKVDNTETKCEKS